MDRLPQRVVRSMNKGFTLIELLVVISIIAILSTVLITNLNSARAKARDSKKTQDLKQMGNAALLMVTNSDSLTGVADTSGTIAFNGLVGFAKTKGYLPASSTVADTSPDKAFEAGWLLNTDGTLNSYRLCAQLEKPADSTKPQFVIENGSSYSAAATPDLCVGGVSTLQRQ